jgi:outer membrane lipoprotein LolB
MTRTDLFAAAVRRIVSTFVLPVVLAGCATFGTPDRAAPDAEAKASARPYRDAIEIGGRLSAHYQQNGSEQAVHGNFTWVQSLDRTRVTLLSPLGQIMATIDITPNSSTLTLAGQAPRAAADVDALAANALGWPLPVSGLRDWLQGFAVNNEGRRVVATPRESAIATRDGWNIRYASWHDDTDLSAHPKRIDLDRDTAEAGNVAIRIVLDNWQPR